MMRGFAFFLTLGAYVVFLSTLDPESGRFYALVLFPLGVAYVVSAIPRRAR